MFFCFVFFKKSNGHQGDHKYSKTVISYNIVVIINYCFLF